MRDAPEVNVEGGGEAGASAGGVKDGVSFEVEGNRLTPLIAGSVRLEALIALIDGARHSLRLLYYIYCDDESGRRVRAAMDAALLRGVDVRLIVDGFGSSVPAHFFDELTRDGADVCRFLPRFGRRYLLRNHQKLALADEERVIIGGFNIQDDYFEDRTGWRDLGLLVEGPAAKRLVGYFDALAEWTHQPKARMRDLRAALGKWSEHKKRHVRWLLGGPTRKLSPWARTVKQEIQRARRLDIISAYFAPHPLMMRRIERVAERGGVSRVITPSKADHRVAIAAARHLFRRMLKRGVRVFEYQPQKLHTKLYVIDDVVHIGSANFDMRSLFLNLELMLRIEDPAFAAHMRHYFEGEMADSRAITPDLLGKASLLDRLRWSIGYFVMAVLDVSVTRRLNFGGEKQEF
ncbi:phosphatidylserine/phosphatidylglycerophosphate/cardiolipin synthase family protein [Sphingomonas sp. AP4-R1]|uniref:phospholipase D-like domain-containing protein n=1 Tax=Sphingomonas sp. AP4-R1 TaxID=2735134 RepID=UPI001493CC08|nr:phosphatidylserine/phosphatidylglycerophosphate/cardiolipin synthase family protein [Sphingomonas sp. AP4-R1]QJU56777.1 phosphatidylserine/phosphatidylglycerophosphate/cardiolipin synthase family protein [Sphingomonas sp. AP4-R1]